MFNDTPVLCFLSPVSLCLFLGFYLIIVYKYFRSRNIPPGPLALPVLGSVGFFRDFKHRRHFALQEACKRYGQIFRVYAGTQLVVFLNGYDVIREAFVKKAAIFSDRPNWLPSLQNGLSEGKGLVWQDSIHAGPARKFARQALREFGMGQTCPQDKILQEMDSVSNVLKEHLEAPVTLKPILKKAISNVIHSVVFGKRFDLDDDELNRLIHLIDDFFKGGLFIPKNFLPRFLRYFLPKNEKEHEMKQRTVNELKEYIYGSISDHQHDFDDNRIRDFVDVYINVSKEENNNVSKGEVFRMILDLFLAGSETTASTLDWCFMFMVKYPDIQEKCFQEIEKFEETAPTADSNVIEWSHRAHLPYIEATIAEVQRLAVIVPLGLPHVTSEDATLQGFVIPKNTIVFGNLFACAMDPNVWSNVNDFKPERHLDDNGHFHNNVKHIPFSIGPRMCLGDSMARLEVFLIFSNLIRQFKFIKHGDSGLEVAHVKESHPISSAEHFQVVIEER